MARLGASIRRRKSRVEDALPLYQQGGEVQTSMSTRKMGSRRKRPQRRRRFGSQRCWCWCLLAATVFTFSGFRSRLWIFHVPGVKMCRNGVLNDDYCECDDGSDEPDTAACSHLLIQQPTFHCKDGSFIIFASRVNDGVTDCADGSDELPLPSPHPPWYALFHF